MLCNSSIRWGQRTQLRRQQRKLWASYYVVPWQSQHSNNNIPTHALFLLILPEYNTSTISPHPFMSFSKLYRWQDGHRMVAVRAEPLTNTQHLGVNNSNHQQQHWTVNQSALDNWQIPTDTANHSKPSLDSRQPKKRQLQNNGQLVTLEAINDRQKMILYCSHK